MKYRHDSDKMARVFRLCLVGVIALTTLSLVLFSKPIAHFLNAQGMGEMAAAALVFILIRKSKKIRQTISDIKYIMK